MANDATTRLAQTTAILLAGGESRRMGTDKAKLSWQGRPLWRHVRDLLHAAGCRRVLVSGQVDDPAAIPDAAPGSGPLGGIGTVLANLPSPPDHRYLLVVPVDLPLLTTAAIHHLVAAGDDAPAACFAGHALPLYAGDTPGFRAALAAVLQAPQRRDRSVRALLARLGAREVPLPPALAPALTNTNTPAEWTAAGAAHPPA